MFSTISSDVFISIQDLLERAEGGEDDSKDLLEEAAVSELEAASNRLQQELDIIADMIQTPTYHPRHYQVSSIIWIGLKQLIYVYESYMIDVQ